MNLTKFSLPVATVIATAVALAVPLAGCSDEQGAASQESVGNETLATAIADDKELSALSGALNDTQLAPVFDGTAAYTVLAPANSALEPVISELADGEAGNEALLAAILRDHVLPGAMNPEDIRDAIAAEGGQVAVKTMGEGTVTFSMAADTIEVAMTDGATARLLPGTALASNGAVIPIDGVLKEP